SARLASRCTERSSSSRSSGSGMNRLRRVDMSSSHTSASKRSLKLSDLVIASCRNRRISARSVSLRGSAPASALQVCAAHAVASRKRLQARNMRGNKRENIGERNFLGIAVATAFVFDLVVGQRALPDDKTMGNADQLHVRKFHARALVAVIQENIIAKLAELCVKPVRLFAHTR